MMAGVFCLVFSVFAWLLWNDPVARVEFILLSNIWAAAFYVWKRR